MNKQIIFNQELVPLVKTKEKFTTWRCFDRQNLQPGETVDLVDRKNMSVFATAQVLRTKLTTFAKLTADDKAGHEKFSSDKEMYKTYSGYYKTNIVSSSPLKVVKFKIIQKFY